MVWKNNPQRLVNLRNQSYQDYLLVDSIWKRRKNLKEIKVMLHLHELKVSNLKLGALEGKKRDCMIIT